MSELTDKHRVPDVFRELPLSAKNENDMLLSLDRFGGFPEPFIKQNERILRRWHNEKNSRLFKEPKLYLIDWSEISSTFHIATR